MDGNYSYTVSSADSSFLAPPAGRVQVDGSTVNVTLLFQSVTYPVNFIAKGLPPGAAWTLNLSGGIYATRNGTLTFDEQNGSYPYTVSSANSSFLAPPPGSVEVVGSQVNVSLVFPEVTYAVTFTSTGLPPEAGWTLNVSGGTHATSNGTLTFQEPNGTYAYSVSTANSSILAPSAGSVQVDGSPVNVSLSFRALGLLTADFTVWYGLESCAASGAVTNAVTLNGTASGGLPPYSFQWTLPVGSSSGSQANTTLTSGSNTTVTLTVSDRSHHSTTVSRAVGVQLPSCHSGAKLSPYSPTSLELWALYAGVGALIVAAVATGLLLLRRRRKTRNDPP